MLPERRAELHRRRADPRARGQVQEAYLGKLAAAVAERIHLGDPFDDATTMGPLNNAPVADKTERHVAEAVDRGASVVTGGSRAGTLGSDLFFEATVLDGVTDEMEVAREETFGPVVPVSTIRHEQEAIELVNGSEYGLLSAVFTRDLGRGLRFAEAVRTGWVNVNEGTNYWESHLPFGGRSRLRERHRPRRRPLLDGAPHRAQDDRRPSLGTSA